jgi:hypothetical protein
MAAMMTAMAPTVSEATSLEPVLVVAVINGGTVELIEVALAVELVVEVAIMKVSICLRQDN